MSDAPVAQDSAESSSQRDERLYREGVMIHFARTLDLSFESRKAWAQRISKAYTRQSNITLRITDDDIRNGREHHENPVSHEGQKALFEVYSGLCAPCQEVASGNLAMRRALFKAWAEKNATSRQTLAALLSPENPGGTVPEGVANTRSLPGVPDMPTGPLESRSSVLPGVTQVLNMPQGHLGAPMGPLRSFNSALQDQSAPTDSYLQDVPRPKKRKQSE
ncbi:hypothetical protein CMUS01_14885 [Colletotrichum musicola]|uniref:Uncharacterized protein n=1 Tax=Colletotrichum musicola TaxID=2175873 RepID=A0A8H6J0J4_9PEZI|nr:hypothetical protein CMUS01_14885 [Colletotrichum musicola]